MLRPRRPRSFTSRYSSRRPRRTTRAAPRPTLLPTAEPKSQEVAAHRFLIIGGMSSEGLICQCGRVHQKFADLIACYQWIAAETRRYNNVGWN